MSSDVDASPGDELLRWASEVGSGTWDRLRDACAYVTEKHRIRRRPWVLASELASLGHLDIDWQTRAWSIAPPAINLVPGLGLCTVLTGSRPHYVDHRFDEATDDLGVYPFEVRQSPAPTAKFAKCASIEIAESVADRLGAALVLDPANALSAVLRPVDLTPSATAPEPPLDEASRFDAETLTWDLAHGRRPGLYRIDLHGRPVHRRFDGWAWWAVDLPVGQFLELQGREEPVIRWRPPTNEAPAIFEARREVALPLLAERALTVNSGLLPHLDGCWLQYRNIHRVVAERLSAALLQQLPTVWKE